MKSARLDLLTKLIIESGLIEYTDFTEKDKYILRLYLKKYSDNKELLSDSEILPTTEIDKLLQVIKNLIVKSKRLDRVLLENQKIVTELKHLKTKFKREIGDETQATLNFDEGLIPLNMIHFSVRANNVLAKLNISTINDLNKLTKTELRALKNIGMKTLNEIVDKASEVGVKIK